MKGGEHRTVWLLMAAHVMICGCGHVIVKLTVSELEPFAFAFWRFLLGAVLLLLIAWGSGGWPRIERRDRVRALVLGILAVPLNQMLYLIGMDYSVPSHVSILFAGTAAFALIMSSIAGYEKPRLYKVAAIIVALIGVTLVVIPRGDPEAAMRFLTGDLIVLGAVVAWAGYTVVSKPLVARYGALPLTSYCLTVGSLITLPFLLPRALMQDYGELSWVAISGVLYSGFLLTAVAYAVWFGIVRRIEPSQAAILTSGQPFVATVLSILIIGEVMTIGLVAGGMLVIAGVLLMNLPVLQASFKRTGSRSLT